MPISYPQPSSDVVGEALAGAKRSRIRVGTKGYAELVEPPVTEAHQVFTLTPDVVRAGKGIEEAKAAGWRFFTPQSEGLAVDLAIGRREVIETMLVDGKQKFARRQGGWLGDATKRTMELVEQLAEAQSSAYELRMLRVPGIARTDCIWLKSLGAAGDLVVPIASTSPGVAAGKAYSSPEFMELMREEASKPTFDNRPRRRDGTDR